MPRTLNATLEAALDSGSFQAYFLITAHEVGATPGIVETAQPLKFKLRGINLEAKWKRLNGSVYSGFSYLHDLEFKITRGVTIAGVNYTIDSSYYYGTSQTWDGTFQTITACMLPDRKYSAAGDVTYKTMLDTLCTNFSKTAKYKTVGAAWQSYKFLGAGKILNLNRSNTIMNMLKQKYLVYACDNGNNEILFKAIGTDPDGSTNHTLSIGLINEIGYDVAQNRRFLYRDETGSIHYSGNTDDPLWNLGYLESTATAPAQTFSFPFSLKPIAPHLKYLSFDFFAFTFENYPSSGILSDGRILEVTEEFDYESNGIPWSISLDSYNWAKGTEGGALPGTIEQAAPYTPLNTSHFNNILSVNDNNIQAAMDTIDDHDHDAETQALIDASISGLSPKSPVRLATAAALPTVTYSNGAAGVGATLTAVATGVLTIDGVTAALNDRVLVKDQAAGLQNGIYLCTLAGAVGVAFILTRATDNDTSAEIIESYTFAEEGTANSDKGYICTNDTSITIGTTAIVWAQFSNLLTFNDGEGDPADIGTAADGTSAYAARRDHVHGGREVLSAARTYYVRTDGSDSNTGLANTAGGAFLTIQKAIDIACGLDLSTYAVTIQVGNGTYTGANSLKTYLGVGPITIIGDTATPANVIISTTSASCFTADTVLGKWQLKGMKLQTTTSGTAIASLNGSYIEFSDINFGACATIHISAITTGQVFSIGNSTVSGGAIAHYYAESGGNIYDNTRTITGSGTFSFSTAYAYASNLGQVYAVSNTYTGGTITGKRYDVSRNGNIYVAGGGANYFPGNSAGTAATGGQYN